MRTNLRRSLPAALVLGAALFAVIAAFAPLSGCGGASGHLTASVDTLDFGTVAHGEEAARTVRVKNAGRRAVLLTAAIPSCACLHVDSAFQRSLLGGEETEIRVILTSDTVTPQKLQHKYLEVRSDDDQAPVLRVALIGEIQARLSLVPQVLRVGPDDAAGRGHARQVKLRTAKGYRATIQSSELSHPSWFLVAQKATPDGSIDLIVSVTPDPTRRGPVDAKLKLKVLVNGGSLPPQVYEPVLSIQGSW